MTLSFALVAVALTFGVYLLAATYVRRSVRSFASAKRAWSDLNASVQAFLAEDVPQSAARVAVGLMSAAGCGCFVRGVLISHYLPRVSVLPRSAGAIKWEKDFSDLANLRADQKAKFERVIGLVIIYDSFRNPLQGWAFRRMMRSFASAEPSFTEKLEAQLAAVSVLSRRKVA